MKKGIVMEKNRQHVIVMAADGTFHKTRYKNDCQIGEEIEFKVARINFFEQISSLWNTRVVTSIALVLLLVFTPMLFWNQSNEAYAFVNVDINPSIELAINEKLNVTELTPFNDEAQQVVGQLGDWKNKSVEIVTMMIVQQTKAFGYMESDQDVLIGVSYLQSLEKKEDISEKILSYMNQEKDDSVEVVTFEVPKEIHDQAEKEKVSMNYLYAQEVAKKQENISSNTTNVNDKSKNDKVHQKLIEKFIEKDKPVPPGIKKKVNDEEKEDESIPPGLQKKDELPSGSFKGANDTPPGLEDKKTPPGHQKNDKKTPPGLEKKKNGNGNGNQKGNHKGNGEEFTPPGLQKKLQ
ncbi:anti-sigma factor domain-containing protein [Salinibacillus xinjiangensis]|uniref:Anti-sigma factor domain-containing protein n=1 Tax=Salinibacillus xinjiangensis TaxID=1229268 RepID=A0A6G1X7D8_9BACI|nr:anti-sigma factor domain-containing protein [Salinibacillus xinjiangensis]MRG86852.1 anti-sigma factor domain-containing protein [Salinibacillus xinjiangensis]